MFEQQLQYRAIPISRGALQRSESLRFLLLRREFCEARLCLLLVVEALVEQDAHGLHKDKVETGGETKHQ